MVVSLIIFFVPFGEFAEAFADGTFRGEAEVTLKGGGIGVSSFFSVIYSLRSQIFSVRNHYRKSTGLSLPSPVSGEELDSTCRD